MKKMNHSVKVKVIYSIELFVALQPLKRSHFTLEFVKHLGFKLWTLEEIFFRKKNSLQFDTRAKNQDSRLFRILFILSKRLKFSALIIRVNKKSFHFNLLHFAFVVKKLSCCRIQLKLGKNLQGFCFLIKTILI